MTDDLFRITPVRLSNALVRLRSTAIVAFGVAVLLFCAYQLYSAAFDGNLESVSRWKNERITYRTDPSWYVFSVVFYSFSGLLVLALFAAAIWGWFGDRRLRRKLKSKPLLDDAIRQMPEER